MTAITITRALWLSLILAALFAAAWATRRRRTRALVARLRREWGAMRTRERDMAAIASYHRGIASKPESLDDRTWEDLNLDSVFTILDRTESAVGQQALYHRLRTAAGDARLDAFESLVTCVGGDAAVRERLQIALAAARDADGYDVWRLGQAGALELEPWHVLFPIFGLMMVAALAFATTWPGAIVLLAAGAVVSLVTRAIVARNLRVVVGPFRQLGPLLAAASRIAEVNCPGAQTIIGTLRQDVSSLARLRRVAGWVSRQTAGSFDLASVMFEYLNMLFFLDANAFYFGARELRAKGPELMRVIAAVGDVDAAISVASYRATTTGWIRPVWSPPGSRVVFSGIRHPLLADAVPNTVIIDSPAGLIVTGSNMSGKSTFLRTVGLTTVLAQTIHTCLAAAYEAPRLVVRSCIGRSDDPATGKSYYLVEVDAVLEIVRAGEGDVPHLLLFDELFRGTNAVERIAAGEAVLRSLLLPRADGRPSPHVVLAATHDQDLVELVAGVYSAYHFSDAVGDDGLAFDYQLRPGPATTRNAIALLQLRGAPAELVSRALARAEALDRSRR